MKRLHGPFSTSPRRGIMSCLLETRVHECSHGRGRGQVRLLCRLVTSMLTRFRRQMGVCGETSIDPLSNSNHSLSKGECLKINGPLRKTRKKKEGRKECGCCRYFSERDNISKARCEDECEEVRPLLSSLHSQVFRCTSHSSLMESVWERSSITREKTSSPSATFGLSLLSFS